MATLGVNLGTVGISQATGYQLVAQREQLDTILPRANGVAKAAAKETANAGAKAGDSPPAAKSPSAGGGSEAGTAKKSAPAPGPKQLTPEQQRIVQELQQIDHSVRAHEQAHLAAGREVITSAANFTYTYGPDGKQYAVGGEVGIDTSAESKPQDNIDKGRLIQKVALAPRDPSPQDYRVASIGSQLEARGRSDLMREQDTQARPVSENSIDATRQQLTRTYSAGSTAGNAVGSDSAPAAATLNTFA